MATHRSTRRFGLVLALVTGLFGAVVAPAVVETSAAGAAGLPATSSQGKDFWLTFEQNLFGGGGLYLFVSGNTATTGTVSVPGIAFSQDISVTPGTVTTVQLPEGAEDLNSDSVDALGVHVTANDPVSVYGLNTQGATTDGFLGLPTPILGTEYLVEGFTNSGVIEGTQFAVVGVEADTHVTIVPSETVGGHTAATPYPVTLGQGDVYQLTDNVSENGDLSGTLVTSDKPVAVFGGHSCGNVPDGETVFCNTLAEEMTPLTTWGTHFVTEPFATRTSDLFRFMAAEDGTTVSVNGSTIATLNAGQFAQTQLASASSVTANQPIQVMQYSNGTAFDGADGDPFDITIPPAEQFLNSYTVSTPPTDADPNITQNYLNVVAPSSQVAAVLLDGSAIPSASFSPIAGTSYSGAQVAVDFGSHTVSAALPFGLTVYGFGNADGYGYPGGFAVGEIATVTNVALAPTSQTHGTGNQACETATVTDQSAAPVEGVRVDFTVTGANATSAFAFTGADGTAQFCYNGANAGDDTETAAVGAITSNAATNHWTPPETSLALSTTTLAPNPVASGGSALWDVSVANPSASTLHKIVVTFSLDQGTLNLTGMNAQNGGGCTKKGTTVSCKAGDLGGVSSRSIMAVVSTTGVAAGTNIALQAHAVSLEGPTADLNASLSVIAANPKSTTTYVPSKGSVTIGGVTPTAGNPTVGTLKLPAKILVPGSTKLQPGPGAFVTLSQEDPATQPGACGGDADTKCSGFIIDLCAPSDQPPAVECGAFSGYNDPKHPAFLKVTWFGGTLNQNSVLYVIVDGVGTTPPKCLKTKGAYTNTPCVTKQLVNKKTGQITDTLALLSTDPGISRR